MNSPGCATWFRPIWLESCGRRTCQFYNWVRSSDGARSQILWVLLALTIVHLNDNGERRVHGIIQKKVHAFKIEREKAALAGSTSGGASLEGVAEKGKEVSKASCFASPFLGMMTASGCSYSKLLYSVAGDLYDLHTLPLLPDMEAFLLPAPSPSSQLCRSAAQSLGIPKLAAPTSDVRTNNRALLFF